MLRYRSGSTGEEINLSGKHIKAHIKTAGFYDYEYEVNEIELSSGIAVSGFSRKSKQYDLILDFRGNSAERADAAEKFLSITNRDIVNQKIGRLYFKEYYLNCYIVSSEYENAGRARVVRKTAGIYAPQPVWITEEKRSFQKILSGSGGTAENLDYPYDYNYDYTMPYGGDVIWQVDHYAPCEYEMIIYGPCVDPRVVINGHIYQVYATLDENDYLKINSRENAVVQYLANGTQRDLYDYRVKITGSLFDPITPGNVRVVWSGEFGFDLTLFCERSEPRWKTQDS